MAAGWSSSLVQKGDGILDGCIVGTLELPGDRSGLGCLLLPHPDQPPARFFSGYHGSSSWGSKKKHLAWGSSRLGWAHRALIASRGRKSLLRLGQAGLAIGGWASLYFWFSMLARARVVHMLGVGRFSPRVGPKHCHWWDFGSTCRAYGGLGWHPRRVGLRTKHCQRWGLWWRLLPWGRLGLASSGGWAFAWMRHFAW